MKSSLSFLYKLGRRSIIDFVYFFQMFANKQKDLETAVDVGDILLTHLPQVTYKFEIPTGIGVNLHDLYFPSPLTLASFKSDLSVVDVWLTLGLGGACLKTVMHNKREGNKRPRLREVAIGNKECIINAMGLPGPDIEDFVKKLENNKIFSYNKPIGFSFGGSSFSEYIDNFRVLNDFLSGKQFPYYYELNISCPNTPEGQQLSKNPELLDDIIYWLRYQTNAVLGVKFSPDTEDKKLQTFADLLKKYSKTYINLGNTKYYKCEELGLNASAISIGGGGVSGPILYNRTLEMIKLISKKDIPIIATGGVDSAEKVKELQNNGATLVGMATAVVHDMYSIPIINSKLASKSLFS